MYVGIDIGGTKTLVSSLDDNGVITEKIRFETAQDYDEQLRLLQENFHKLQTKDFRAGGVGMPGLLDLEHGRGIVQPNLPWQNVSIVQDLENMIHCPIVLQNDSKLASLSEAMLLKHDYSKVLYVTISTGIGFSLVENQQISSAIPYDPSGNRIMIHRHGKYEPWEQVVSGRAIVKRFGKMAKDIDDEATWNRITEDIASGMIELIAVLEPQIIVIGGSVGTHFHKYGRLLEQQLKKYQTPALSIPPVMGAGRPEEAVLFGCYDLAKQTFVTADNQEFADAYAG